MTPCSVLRNRFGVFGEVSAWRSSSIESGEARSDETRVVGMVKSLTSCHAGESTKDGDPRSGGAEDAVVSSPIPSARGGDRGGEGGGAGAIVVRADKSGLVGGDVSSSEEDSSLEEVSLSEEGLILGRLLVASRAARGIRGPVMDGWNCFLGHFTDGGGDFIASEGMLLGHFPEGCVGRPTGFVDGGEVVLGRRWPSGLT